MKYRMIILVFLLASTLSLQAREISGINISETITFPSQPGNLKLNGSGIRSKFIFDIYIGSLYLEMKSHTPKDIYKLHGKKRVSMHFLYDAVEKEKLTTGWTEGFENNLTEKEFEKLKHPLKQFNTLFIDVKKGDVINLDFIPNSGTYVVINNNKIGMVPGADFYAALLKVWLGNDPADEDLKEAMLGIDNNDSADD